MSKNKTIAFFYAGVGLLCVLLIVGFNLLGKKRDRDNQREYKERQQMRQDEMNRKNEAEYKKRVLEGMSKYGLKEDLLGVDHNGEKVNLKESYKGKVVVFAQFYGSCPHCMAINFKALATIRDKYKDEADLHIVTVNVNAGDTNLATLKNYEEVWGKGMKWSFVNTFDVPAFDKWANKNIGYANMVENVGEQIAEDGPISHDMKISVFSREGIMINFEDLYSALKSQGGSQANADAREDELLSSIEFALKQEMVSPKPEVKKVEPAPKAAVETAKAIEAQLFDSIDFALKQKGE